MFRRLLAGNNFSRPPRMRANLARTVHLPKMLVKAVRPDADFSGLVHLHHAIAE